MTVKFLRQVGLLQALLLLGHVTHAQSITPFGQAIEIRTNLTTVAGNPSWILILRDIKNGGVFPYIFDFQKEENFWVAFSYSQLFRVTVSRLQFDDDSSISNFCNIENSTLSHESMTVVVKGVMSPTFSSPPCLVKTFKAVSFPIVVLDEQPSDSKAAETQIPPSSLLAPLMNNP